MVTMRLLRGLLLLARLHLQLPAEPKQLAQRLPVLLLVPLLSLPLLLLLLPPLLHCWMPSQSCQTSVNTVCWWFRNGLENADSIAAGGVTALV